MDLDLAVASPLSGFSDAYRASFAARVAAARVALAEVGAALPEEAALPPGFPYRVGLGSYTSGSALCAAVDTFVAHLRAHGTLPYFAPTRAPAALPECLQPLEGADHLIFSLDALFVPVDLEVPLVASADGETFPVRSSVRALAALRVVEALAHLDEERMWDWQDVLPEAPGEPFRGYRLMAVGFPDHADLWGVEKLVEAMQLSVRYGVAVIVS